MPTRKGRHLSPIPGEKRNEPSSTPTGSFGSVKVFWLDRSLVLERITKAVKVLKQDHPEIEEVILFGSLARGDAVPGSDGDLLVVLRESSVPFPERGVRYRVTNVGVGGDVCAYTRAELDAMLATGNSFVARALREGIVLEDRVSIT